MNKCIVLVPRSTAASESRVPFSYLEVREAEVRQRLGVWRLDFRRLMLAVEDIA